MKGKSIVLLILHLVTVGTTSYASPVIKLAAKSLDTAAPMKLVAQVLNVTVPANWTDYIGTPITDGSVGQAQVGITTLATAMASWIIPEEFRVKAVESVKILITAAAEGSYVAQAFTFNTQSGALFTTLLIVAKKIVSPTKSDLPIAATYVTINTKAEVKKLYTTYYTDRCFQCGDCVYMWDCCCKRDQAHSAERGVTPEELNIIKQKMSAEQFKWFNERTLSSLVKRSLPDNDINYRVDNINSLTEAVENFLSNNIAKVEVLTPYNDSILRALQSNITSLKLSSQILKLAKVERQNVATLLKELATEYGFNDISNSQKFDSSRFSYEQFFTSQTNQDNTDVSIKYIWLLGQNLDNSAYTINFLFLNITSRALINTLLNHNPNNNGGGNRKKLDIVRTSTLTDSGEFLSENLPTLITPWEMKTTNIALNILRFISASVFVPQKHRMLSYFDSQVTSPENNTVHGSQPRSAATTIIALSQAVSAMANAWKDVANAFKTTTSTTITKLIRLGFTYFHQKSTSLKALDIPATKVSEFINALIIDYSLPSKGNLMLGVTYSNDVAWDSVEYLYSPGNNGKYRSLTLFKNGDNKTNTASFFVVDVNNDWELAPDLLLIRKSSSKLGGLFEDTSESIQEVPHILAMDEAAKLQQFFMVIAMGNMAATLGINVTYPSLT